VCHHTGKEPTSHSGDIRGEFRPRPGILTKSSHSVPQGDAGTMPSKYQRATSSLHLAMTVCRPIYLSTYLSMALQPSVGPCPPFSFLILYTVGKTPSSGDQPVARPLPTHRTTQTENKFKHTSMPRVRLEPTTTVFEWEKAVHALDRGATAIGAMLHYPR
jgi:hypothetical protein